MGVEITSPGQSWTSVTGDNLLVIKYTNDTGKDKRITSITCQVAAGTKDSVVYNSSGGISTASGKGGWVQLKANGVYVSNQPKVTKTVDAESKGSSKYKTGYFKNIGGNNDYNIIFNVNLEIKNNASIIFNVFVTGLEQGAIITTRKASSQYVIVNTEDLTVNPTSVEADKTTINITDLSGAAKNASVGVKIGPSETIKFTASPDNSQVTSIVIKGNNIKSSSSINGIIITSNISAANYNTDKSTVNCTATLNGGAKTSFTVNFQEKIKKISVKSNNVVMNIREILNNKNALFDLNGEQNGNCIVYKDNFSRGPNNACSASGNKLTLTGDGAFSLNKESSFLPLEYENTPIKLYWNFYNSNVQEYWSTAGTYRNTIDTTFTYTITPTLSSQFFYTWKDTLGNAVSDIPDIILPNQSNITIKELKYLNTSPYGGYCRGFEVVLLDADGNETEYKSNFNIADLPEISTYDGDIFSSFKNNVDLGLYSVKIKTYFYFNNGNKSYGTSVILPQKLLFIKDESLLPELSFPNLANKEHMMLSAVERYGYSFNEELAKYLIYQDTIKLRFGLNINDVDYLMSDNQEYFSSNKITSHLVFNAGKFVTKHHKELYKEELYKDEKEPTVFFTVKPYIDIMYNTKYVKTITADDVTTKKTINSESDITESKFWVRPETKQGNLVTYFDANKCEDFINKYKALIYNYEQNLPKNKQGLIIKTDFWEDIAAMLEEYSDNMYAWATDSVNMLNLWAIPQFLHKKGEIITYDNLYQNYWDLLNQYSGADGAFATHDFLNKSKFTHNYLSKFTHYQITFKRGLK